jgi:hypothetical protein
MRKRVREREGRGGVERGILHIKLRAKEYITSSVVNIPYALSVASYTLLRPERRKP